MAIKKINTELQLESALRDGNGSPGTNGQVLSSTGTATDWISLSEIQGVDGTGTANYISKWSDTDTITNSIIFDNGSNVGIGTTSPLGKLQVNEYTVGSQGNQNVYGELSVFANSGNESLFLGIKNAAYPNRGWAFNPVTNGVNSDLQIKEHGDSAVRMTLRSAGNVGIGTTSPQAKLHVLTSDEVVATFESSDNKAAIKIADNDTTGYVSAENGRISIGTSQGLHANNINILTSNYNVGIGTTSPETKLDTNGVILARGGSWNGGGSESNKNAAMVIEEGYQIYTRDGGTDLRVLIGKVLDYINIGHANTAYIDGIRFYSGSSANYHWYDGSSEVMRLNSTGLGIGTTSPTSKLHVHGGGVTATADKSIVKFFDSSGISNGVTKKLVDAAITKLGWSNSNVYSGSFETNVSGRIGDVNAYGVSSLVNYDLDYTDASSEIFDGKLFGLYSKISISTTTGNTFAEDAYGLHVDSLDIGTNSKLTNYYGIKVSGITGAGTVTNKYALVTHADAGNVGIGTFSPARNLHVHASSGNAYLQLTQGSTGVTSNDGFQISMGASQVNFINRENGNMVFETNNTEKMRITSGGNVGIGTTSPSTILHVKKNDATGPTITLENNSNQTYINNWGSSGPSGRTNRFEINATATSSMALAAQYISLQTVTAGDSYEKVRITSSGNVGIGVTNPQDFNSEANNLVIGTGSGAEGMTIYGGSSGGSYIYFADGTSGSALYEGFLQYRHSERAMRFGTATGVRMTLDASGNLGIGTTSPYGKLNVIPSSNPTTPTTANQIAIGESSANSWYNLRLGYFLEDGAYKGSIQSIAGNTPSTLVLNGDGGNVGIGTTSPNSVLNVEGTKTVALTSAAHFLTLGLSIDDNNTYDTLGAGGGVAFRGVNNSSGTRIVYGAIDAFKESSNTADYRGSLRFFTNQNSTAVPLERMRIDSSGNVGIGTTSPNRNLHVAGSGTTVAVKVQATDGSQASLDLQNTEGWFRLINDGGSLSIYDQADSVERFRINTSGNIGIGTTSPVAKLDIAGVGTGPSVYDYAYTQNAGARIHGNESALEIIGTDSGNHGSSILLRNGDEGFGFINNPNIDALQLKSFTANGNGFTIHGTGGSVDSLVDIMTIEKTGRVGIGTSSPAGTLHVVGLAGDQGSIYVSDIDNGANAGDSLLITKSGTNAFIYNRDGGHLRLGSNNQSSNLTINSSGDVGIGTTGPTQRLHVRSGVTNHVAKFESTDSIAEITIQDNSTYTRLLNISTDFKLMPNDGSTEFIFEGDTGNFVNPGHIKLVDNGKVQFGNSNDFDIYHNSTTNQNIIQSNLGRQLLLSSDSTVIKSDLDSTILYIDTNDGAIGDSASIRFNGSRAQVGWIDTAVTLTDGGANKDIKLKVNNGGIFLMTSNTARMFVNSSGNVGIGTTSPDYKLEVDGTLGVSRTDGIIFAGSLGTGTGNKIYSDTSNNFIISTATASAPYSSNERLRILNANGNVGIGTTNPQAKLDISTTGTGDSMIIRNNDASSSAAPVLMLLRDSASAANGDYLGQIKFKGNSDTGAERVYAKITAKISDATNGAEDSLIETAVRDNGSNLIVSRQTHQNLKLINGTGLESDGDIYMPIVGKGLIIKSPDGTRYRITVDNSGNLGTELA